MLLKLVYSLCLLLPSKIQAEFSHKNQIGHHKNFYFSDLGLFQENENVSDRRVISREIRSTKNSNLQNQNKNQQQQPKFYDQFTVECYKGTSGQVRLFLNTTHAGYTFDIECTKDQINRTMKRKIPGEIFQIEIQGISEDPLTFRISTSAMNVRNGANIYKKWMITENKSEFASVDKKGSKKPKMYGWYVAQSGNICENCEGCSVEHRCEIQLTLLTDFCLKEIEQYTCNAQFCNLGKRCSLEFRYRSKN